MSDAGHPGRPDAARGAGCPAGCGAMRRRRNAAGWAYCGHAKCTGASFWGGEADLLRHHAPQFTLLVGMALIRACPSHAAGMMRNVPPVCACACKPHTPGPDQDGILGQSWGTIIHCTRRTPHTTECALRALHASPPSTWHTVHYTLCTQRTVRTAHTATLHAAESAHCALHAGGVGWGDFVWGEVRGENFVFQFGVKNFPTKCFCAIWGISCSLCILSGGGSQVWLRCCRQSVWALFFFLSSLMSWYCSKFVAYQSFT